MTFFSEDLIWWISAIDIPALAGLFYLIWRTRQENQKAQAELHSVLENRYAQLRESLSSYKLEVAKTYASHSEVKDLEARLIEHLLRIEAKLDNTALKTERLYHEPKNR